MKRSRPFSSRDMTHNLGWGTLLGFALAVIPGVVAADFGGILPWTAWAAGIGLVLIGVLALPLVYRAPSAVPISGYRLSAVWLLLAVVGIVQWIPLPLGLLGWLGGGSAEAYSSWLAPFAGDHSAVTAMGSLSIDRALTLQATWYVLQLAVCLALSTVLFAERKQLFVVLAALALAGLVHAGLGIFQRLTAPQLTVWGIIGSAGGAPFGAFVNRSNASVTLLLGLAASLGLLAWRLSAITGFESSRGVRFKQLADLIFDRLACIAIVASLGLVFGLLVCGSRSGLAGTLGGLGVSLVLLQRLHKSRGVLITLIAVTIISVVVIGSTDFAKTTIDRTSATIEQTLDSQQFSDGRFDHWPDGLRASWQQPLLGWGLGAYRYAYLPFQRSSSGGWFINADNLWLELLVESGLVGMTIVLVCLGFIAKALRKLGRSFDPVDHGLAMAGWFALGALCVSQFFDFGLKLHGNSLAAAVLFGAVVGRAAVIEVRPLAPLRHSRRSSVRTTSSASLASNSVDPTPLETTPAVNRSSMLGRANLAVLAVGIVLSLLSVAGFYHGAIRDAVSRQAERVLRDSAASPHAQRQAFEQLELLNESQNSDARSLVNTSSLRMVVARTQASERLPEGPEADAKRKVLRGLSSVSLRSLLYPESILPDERPAFAAVRDWLGDDAEASLDAIRDAAQLAQQDAADAVRLSPFSAEARQAWLNSLVTPNQADAARVVIQQAATLRQRNPTVLAALAKRAAELGEPQLAFRLWQQTITLQPRSAPVVLMLASRQPGFRGTTVLPDSADAYHSAVSNRNSRAIMDRESLERATQLLAQHLPESAADRAARFQIIASIQTDLGLLPEATVSLEKAVGFQPRDPALRLRLSETLLSAKQFSQARDVARQGESIFADDPRFRKMLDRIAKEIEQSTILPRER